MEIALKSDPHQIPRGTLIVDEKSPLLALYVSVTLASGRRRGIPTLRTSSAYLSGLVIAGRIVDHENIEVGIANSANASRPTIQLCRAVASTDDDCTGRSELILVLHRKCLLLLPRPTGEIILSTSTAFIETLT